jgi:hypothetical protein
MVGNFISRLHTLSDCIQIPRLTVVFIVSASHPRFFSSAELPHVHFPPYSKEESIEILCKNPLPIQPAASNDAEDDSDDEVEVDPKAAELVWRRYCTTVWDTLAKGAARDVARFRTVAEKNWWSFVEPIARGEYDPKNYTGLYVHKKVMFQRETTLIDQVVPSAVTERTTIVKCEYPFLSTQHLTERFIAHDLPYYSKFLLCAAYLASYNPAGLDYQLFTKGHDGKKRKRGGGQKRPAPTRKVYLTPIKIILFFSPSPDQTPTPWSTNVSNRKVTSNLTRDRARKHPFISRYPGADSDLDITATAREGNVKGPIGCQRQVESQRGARVHPSNRMQHQVRARRLHDRIGAVFFFSTCIPLFRRFFFLLGNM